MKETNWKINIKLNNNIPTSSYTAHGYRNSALVLVECYADTRTKLEKPHFIFLIHGIPPMICRQQYIVYSVAEFFSRVWIITDDGWWSKYRSVNSTLITASMDWLILVKGHISLCKRSVMYILFLLNLYGRKEGNVLFNDALKTFYLQLYGVRHMVKNHSDSERGNPLLPHGLLFSINSKGSFICTIPQTG